MRKHFLVIACLIGILGCDNEKPYEQNLELKSKLQGSWILEEGIANTSDYRLLELEFVSNKMNWYDSLVRGSYVLAKRGFNPVVFGYNNGIVPIDYGSATGRLYYQFDVSDVIWVDFGRHQVNRYDEDTLTFRTLNSTSAAFPIHSSAVDFDSSLNLVEFCHPSFFTDRIECYEFQRVE